MPLSKKGKKIMQAMRKQYGEKEGEKVFYASKNKGTISGVEKNEESKMSYLDKVLNISEEEKRGVKPGSMLADMGITGARKTDLRKLPKGKKTLKNPDQNIAPMGNPKPGAIKSHTEYKRIGFMMAEALGYRIDEMLPALAAAGKIAGKVAGKAVGAAGNMAKKKAMGMAADQMKKREMRKKEMEKEKVTPDAAMEYSWSVYQQIGALMAEAVTKKVGPIASRYSGMGRVKDKEKGKGAQAIGDPVVRKAVRGANERVSKKLGVKANLATDVAAQQGLENRRRKFRKKGIGIPAMTQKERQADARQDVERRKGPDDE